MAEEILDEWTVKGNQALTVTLVTKTDQGPPKTIASFHPTWTYPIVGDDETIYGYKGLKINLHYNASDMRPHISHTSSRKVPEAEAIQEPADINDLLDPYLPAGAQSLVFLLDIYYNRILTMSQLPLARRPTSTTQFKPPPTTGTPQDN